jgi:erythromycin esterase-like protein
VSRSAAFLDDEKSHFGMTVTLETQRFADALSKNQTLAAITTKNVAWVRNHKASIYNLRARRSQRVAYAFKRRTKSLAQAVRR